MPNFNISPVSVDMNDDGRIDSSEDTGAVPHRPDGPIPENTD